jgi:anti-anti-sigma factor
MVMRINVTREGPVSIITVSGEEDTRSEEALNGAFRDCFNRGCWNVLLDLSKLKYLGSRLRKVLLANTKEAVSSGGKIKLLSPQPAVKLILKEHRLLDFFEVYNIRQAALESFGTAAPEKAKESETKETTAALPTPPDPGMDERLDRLENSLIQLAEILRKRGVITEEDESGIFG